MIAWLYGELREILLAYDKVSFQLRLAASP